MGKSKNSPKHRLKELIDSFPQNTNQVKKNLAKAIECSIDKVNIWYRDPQSTIVSTDQFKLVHFFSLGSIADLYTPVKDLSRMKPLKANS